MSKSTETPAPSQSSNPPPPSSAPQPPPWMEERMRVGWSASTSGTRDEPELLKCCEAEYNQVDENYLRGCKWSCDGTALMTNSNDNVIRIFDLNDAVSNNKWDANTELTSTQRIAEIDLIYDFAWYPRMARSNPSSYQFITTTRETPIHLYNALTGELTGTFSAYNKVDEIVAAHSLGFTCDGKFILAGFNRELRSFDISRPGRNCTVTSTITKDPHTGSVKGQRGIVSCFAPHPFNPRLIAAGAFNGDVAIYDIPNGAMNLAFEGQPGGITHIVFSKDGNYVFAGGRKDPEIHCFDMRRPEKQLFSMYRYVATNQRMYFDTDRSGKYLLSGHHNGHVSMWDLKGKTKDNSLLPWPRLDPVSYFEAHQDTCNGLDISPTHPIMATCSGQRHFPESIFRDVDDSPLEPPEPDIEENSLKLWRLQLT
ncbi:telomerase Cajal body protein 1-like [Babylonia areolata]|uniref:telomerase Cajal body protein 1-like n=1 Tax=Babylonia areolata TaxID=304850 RepID=UPI003FD30AD9